MSSVSAQTLTTRKSQTERTGGPKKTSDLLEMVKYSFRLSCYRFTTHAYYFAQMNESGIRTVAIYCVSVRQNSLTNHRGMLKKKGKWLPRVLGRIFPPERVKIRRRCPTAQRYERRAAGEEADKVIIPRKS